MNYLLRMPDYKVVETPGLQTVMLLPTPLQQWTLSTLQYTVVFRGNL